MKLWYDQWWILLLLLLWIKRKRKRGFPSWMLENLKGRSRRVKTKKCWNFNTICDPRNKVTAANKRSSCIYRWSPKMIKRPEAIVVMVFVAVCPLRFFSHQEAANTALLLVSDRLLQQQILDLKMESHHQNWGSMIRGKQLYRER